MYEIIGSDYHCGGTWIFCHGIRTWPRKCDELCKTKFPFVIYSRNVFFETCAGSDTRCYHECIRLFEVGLGLNCRIRTRTISRDPWSRQTRKNSTSISRPIRVEAFSCYEFDGEINNKKKPNYKIISRSACFRLRCGASRFRAQSISIVSIARTVFSSTWVTEKIHTNYDFEAKSEWFDEYIRKLCTKNTNLLPPYIVTLVI